MSASAHTDWNPGAYARFRGLRLRPALDLLKAVPSLPSGGVVDLGCGNGAVGQALATLGRPLIGVDSSDKMLEEARKTETYAELLKTDIAGWVPAGAPALIFSNAALQWLPDHSHLLPRLAGLLAPGGTLAIQVPHQNNAPSHRVWRSLMDEHFPGRVDWQAGPSVMLPAEYFHLLSPLGAFDMWETDYYQVLAAEKDAHPVRKFTESTYARPLLDRLAPSEADRLIAFYETVMEKAYPRGGDGQVLFPMRRLFLLLTRPASA
ncbi:methyltransferase domain-containing protein [Primorskyibacter flagellatus]|uniref:Trans-aconitate 2-methyltransferase n=1 Tax=Primorskyibacter flagellatus TaxID=1387277 RepID=A0A1W2C8J2_9RHOB|nr:methyltransferase domain-containing protein [Primorskyibacter flagellatus]SMC80988.1 trans-aconitate 2-methyltransferase [Primorskyibacter flagellatus]